MKVHVLGNPAARGGTGDVEKVADLLRTRGIETELLEATSAEASEDVARTAVSAGAERLIAVGGDGMVRIAVRAVAETDTVLGLVPQGTGNDFARALGLLEGSLDDHVSAALDPGVPVDAMRTNHGWVASVATMGFAGDVTERANGLRWPRGAQRYTVATLLQLPRLRAIGATIEVDGVVHDAATTMLSIGNTPYFSKRYPLPPRQVVVVNQWDIAQRLPVRKHSILCRVMHCRATVITASGITS